MKTRFRATLCTTVKWEMAFAEGNSSMIFQKRRVNNEEISCPLLKVIELIVNMRQTSLRQSDGCTLYWFVYTSFLIYTCLSAFIFCLISTITFPFDTANILLLTHNDFCKEPSGGEGRGRGIIESIDEQGPAILALDLLPKILISCTKPCPKVLFHVRGDQERVNVLSP